MAGMYGVSAYQQTNKSWEAKNIKPVAGHASDNSQKCNAEATEIKRVIRKR